MGGLEQNLADGGEDLGRCRSRKLDSHDHITALGADARR